MVGAKRNVSWFNNAAKQQSGGEEDKKRYCVRAVSKIMGVYWSKTKSILLFFARAGLTKVYLFFY
jgi:hypothetical protein